MATTKGTGRPTTGSSPSTNPTPATAGSSGASLPSPITEADRYRQEVEWRRRLIREQITRVPVAVLIWGPAPGSGTIFSQTRELLRDRLRADGHLADFSEELIDPGSSLSVQVQQYEHVAAYDVTFSIPASHGSIAELHDFAKMPGVAHKIVAFVDEQYSTSYPYQSVVALQQTPLTCRVTPYSVSDLPTCIIDAAVAVVNKMQEIRALQGALIW